MAMQQLETAFFTQVENDWRDKYTEQSIKVKYDYLSSCLDEWLKNLLTKKIKFGKRKQNVKLDLEPADYVKELTKINLAHPTTAKKKKTNLISFTEKHGNINIYITRKFSVYSVYNS